MIIIIITTTRMMVMMMIMMMMMIVVVVVVVIALKGAIRDFYNLLTVPPPVSNTCAPLARVQFCANHVQHIERLSRATCSVPLGMKGQLSY